MVVENRRIDIRPKGPGAKKQLASWYENYDDFYNEICGGLLWLDNRDEADILSSYAFGAWLFDYYAYRIFKGPHHVFIMKFRSRFSSTFYELRQKERIYKNIYKDLKLEIGALVDLRNTEYHKVTKDETGDEKNAGDETWNRTKKDTGWTKSEEKSGSRQISKERPFETLDLLGQHYGNMIQGEYFGRADFLGGENYESSGYLEVDKYPLGHEKHGEIILDKDGNPSQILNPNWSKNWKEDTTYDDSYKKMGDRSDHRRSGTDIIDRTIERQEQPMINSQIARIAMGYKNFETYPTELILSFEDLFTEYYIGGGEFVLNPLTFEYEYVPTKDKGLPPSLKPKYNSEEEEEEKVRKVPEIDPNRQLSKDEWVELWADGNKPCMPDWYLEGVLRYKKSIEKKEELEDTDHDRIRMCDTLLDSFYKPPYIPPISVYETIMGTPEGFLVSKDLDANGDYVKSTTDIPDGYLEKDQEATFIAWLTTNNLQWLAPWTHYEVDSDNINDASANKKKAVNLGQILKCEVEGFAEFKMSLWEELRVAHRNRKNKVPNFQVFPYLIGPPGTGKSEISRRLAEANKSPLWLINCSGIADPEYFEGKRPTLANASYGKCMAAFIESSALTEITINDLEKDIHQIEYRIDPEDGVERKRNNLTDWEKDKVAQIKLEIKEWELENEERANAKPAKAPKLTKKVGRRSRSPIILLDEFEKMADQAAQDVIGKMTDREMNFSFFDNYFGFRLDLSNVQFLLTANYMDKVPQFIKDRGVPVNIELLSWASRKSILTERFKKELRQFNLAHHANLIDDKFVEMCIPETWGIRGGINNVATTIRFLNLMEVEREEFEDLLVHKKNKINPYAGFKPTGTETDGKIKYTTTLSQPDLIEETLKDDYLKKETGVIRLIWTNLGGKRRELVLAKRIGIETRTMMDGDEEKKVKEIVTGTDAENGKIFVEDWGGISGVYVKPDGNVGTKDDADVVKHQWWYGFGGLNDRTKKIGYIVRSLDKGEPKPGETTAELLPYQGTFNINGWFRYRGASDANYYTIDNVNSTLTLLQFSPDERSLNVKRIKLVAQTALKEKEKYDNLANLGMSREYVLTINNQKDIVWDSTKQQITVFCKWDIDERI